MGCPGVWTVPTACWAGLSPGDKPPIDPNTSNPPGQEIGLLSRPSGCRIPRAPTLAERRGCGHTPTRPSGLLSLPCFHSSLPLPCHQTSLSKGQSEVFLPPGEGATLKPGCTACAVTPCGSVLLARAGAHSHPGRRASIGHLGRRDVPFLNDHLIGPSNHVWFSPLQRPSLKVDETHPLNGDLFIGHQRRHSN